MGGAYIIGYHLSLGSPFFQSPADRVERASQFSDWTQFFSPQILLGEQKECDIHGSRLGSESRLPRSARTFFIVHRWIASHRRWRRCSWCLYRCRGSAPAQDLLECADERRLLLSQSPVSIIGAAGGWQGPDLKQSGVGASPNAIGQETMYVDLAPNK